MHKGAKTTENHTKSHLPVFRQQIMRRMRLPFWIVCICIILVGTGLLLFEKKFQGKIYPNVTVDGAAFGGQTPAQVNSYWSRQNEPFARMRFELIHDNTIATISGSQIDLGYDSALSARQAYLVGRSPNFLSNMYQKFIVQNVNLNPLFRWDTDVVENTLDDLSERLDIPSQNALFEFTAGRVTAFRPSKEGQRVDRESTKKLLTQAFLTASKTHQQYTKILVPVEKVLPQVTTKSANSFGIKELIGRGYSEFAGSIAGRIHNVALAASRINGVLIKPGETFSFNDAVGDISAATGYQSAYIIKDGKTVLGDGGGVCQVSTTLFRAAMDAGLPIVERHAHAYRVHYYEEGGYKPGIDATVFSPSVDLKFKNDTPGYILIQTKTDLSNLSLTFEFYGTSDGRVSSITNQLLWGITPPPPPLYQDDPTLPKGTTKQVDFEAWGANASFEYHVTRNGTELEDRKFVSNYRPWQAVYLQGTQ